MPLKFEQNSWDMRLCFFILCVFYLGLGYAQVGVNTTNPQAQLDIRSSNQAAPSSTDGLLIPKIDAFPATNPTAAQQGMLVYLTTASGSNLPGFYFWDNVSLSWLQITKSDYDFLNASGNAPISINESMYHLGNVGVGTNSPSTTTKLDVQTTTGSSVLTGEYILPLNNSNVSVFNAKLFPDTSMNTGNLIGLKTELGTNGGVVSNGLQNTISGSGTGSQFGVNNQFTGSSSSRRHGFYNYFLNNATINVGLQNDFLTSGERYGVFNNLTGAPSNSYGIYNYLDGSGNALRYGNYTIFRGSSNGDWFGDYIGFDPLTAIGTGRKHGLYVSMPTGVLGSNLYGVYSLVGNTASGFAGYFLGRVAFGTSDTDRYIFPLNRGTFGQIMQTDGLGNVSWKDPDSVIQNVGWLLTGNSGTDTTTNFIGTIDDKDVVFKRFSSISGRIGGSTTSFGNNSLQVGTAPNNSAFGAEALKVNNIGIDNVALGTKSLVSNTIGSSNTAVGSNALATNVIGSANTAIGTRSLFLNTASEETAVGFESLYNNTGNSNVAVGYFTLRSNTSGNNNTAVGYQVLKNSTVSNSNSGFGYKSLMFNMTGSENSGFGNQALLFNSSGSFNAAFGSNALMSNNSGNNNTAIGSYALHSNNNGTSNVAVGYRSLYNNTSGNRNIAIGELTLENSITAYSNIAIGGSAMNTNLSGIENIAIGGAVMSSNNNGSYNTALGSAAMNSNLSGNYNTAAGYQSLFYNSNGVENVSIGSRSMFKNTTGNYNVGVGAQALSENTIGANNSALGYFALYTNVNGGQNTAVGVEALKVSTSSNNTALGYRTAYQLTGGSRNLAIGSLALSGLTNNSFNTAVGSSSYITGNFNNSTALGDGVTITANNQVRIGDAGVTSIGGSVGWSTISDKRFKENIKEDVPGLSFITKLKPVTYQLNILKICDFEYKNKFEDEKLSYLLQLPKSIFSGFLAQDVEEAAQSLGFNFSGIDKPKNENDYYGLRYGEFVVPLVKAVQEQQQIITTQQQQIEMLAEKIKNLELLLKK